jgi:hypothetical protein
MVGGCDGISTKQLKVLLLGLKPHLLPRSFLRVPPYLGLVPIRSIISGIQLAKMAYTHKKRRREPWMMMMMMKADGRRTSRRGHHDG